MTFLVDQEYRNQVSYVLYPTLGCYGLHILPPWVETYGLHVSDVEKSTNPQDARATSAVKQRVLEVSEKSIWICTVCKFFLGFLSLNWSANLG